MEREAAVEQFNEMHRADLISALAVETMQKENIDVSFAVLSMLNHGLVKQCKGMDLNQERLFLVFLEEYLADTREALGMHPNQSFSEVDL